MKKLTEEEIKINLQRFSGWGYNNGALEKHFKFKDFVGAFGFMTKAALIAEKLDHHPDWSNVYNKVSIRLSTHDAGGITEKDFEFVRRVEEITM